MSAKRKVAGALRVALGHALEAGKEATELARSLSHESDVDMRAARFMYLNHLESRLAHAAEVARSPGANGGAKRVSDQRDAERYRALSEQCGLTVSVHLPNGDWVFFDDVGGVGAVFADWDAAKADCDAVIDDALKGAASHG